MNDPEGTVLMEVSGVENGGEQGKEASKCTQARFSTDTAGEPLAVIEISEDGTWETKPITVEELNVLETSGNGNAVDSVGSKTQPDFLATGDEGKVENVKIKHVTLAHSSQYYVNCPVASIKPMVQESLSNGTGGPEAGIAKTTKVNETFSNGCEIEAVKFECSASAGMMNGGTSVGVYEGDSERVKDVPSCSECVVAEAVTADGCADTRETQITLFATNSSSSAEEKDITANSLDGGVVVTDSILQNKEKTKTYWEEMMMAAAASSGKESPSKTRPSRGSVEEGVEASEEEVEEAVEEAMEEGGGDAGSESPEAAAAVPKIVETVAKKAEDGEEASPRAEEARRSWAGARAETPAELKIALELREMREREEELRRVRQQLGMARDEGEEESAPHSIPTTDEGNFSECGAEEKELSADGKSHNDTMSPDMPSLESPQENGSYVHRRTQSMDSTSSGHSSASGGQRVGNEYPPRRRIIVKPFTNTEEDQNFRETVVKDENIINLENQQPTSPFCGLKETPIEREIRIAREREEELRREKGLIQTVYNTPTEKPEVPIRSPVPPVTPTGKGPQNVQLLLATNRIQREILETTEREKELREAGKIQTMSEDTVDSKVTRIGERMEGSAVVFEPGKKIQKSMSAFLINVPDAPCTVKEEETRSPTPPTPAVKPTTPHATPTFTLNRSISANAGLGLVGSGSTSSPSPRRFIPTGGQKGLMERFLASRGKMTCISPFSSSSSSSSSPSSSTTTTTTTPTSSHSSSNARSSMSSPSPVARNTSNSVQAIRKPLDVPMDNQQVSKDSETVETVHRRGWMSAEEKIQEELKEMKMREDELRLQRAHIMAQSQPNLLSIMDEVDEGSHWNEDESKLPSLYSTLSNPSLLDLDGDSSVKETEATQEQGVNKSSRRKKSSLIAHWENRIQQNN